MGYVSQIIKGFKAGAKGAKIAAKVKKVAQGIEKASENFVFRIKPEITMPVNASTINNKVLTRSIDCKALQTSTGQGELGNIAIRHADLLKKKEKYAQKACR